MFINLLRDDVANTDVNAVEILNTHDIHCDDGVGRMNISEVCEVLPDHVNISEVRGDLCSNHLVSGNELSNEMTYRSTENTRTRGSGHRWAPAPSIDAYALAKASINNVALKLAANKTHTS